uniref:Putative ubiquitin-conjugating enzyme-related protein ft1 involved in programmed cell death n=1 Tax=Panstrongylus megistus TaxID=65343 RepID=A0A069DS15_9HEMI
MAGRVGAASILAEKDGNENLQRHGSIRKVLHSLVGNDSLLGISARMLDRPKQYRVEDDLNPYQDFLREYALISEYKILCQHLIPGLYMIPSANSGLVWYGVLFVRSGVYKGGIFRITLKISENFPDSTQPSVIFEDKIFHPNINEETQELNVMSVFPVWSKHENHLWQVLEYTSKIFYQISTKNAVNITAAQLYDSDIEKYKEIAQTCVEQSKQNIFHRSNNEDANYIRFQEFNESMHSEARLALLSAEPKMKNISKCGLSWVKEGTLKPCSLTPYKS